MAESTVWACEKCGRCHGGPSAEQCIACGGTMAQLAESDALRRFMEDCEPVTGWYDYDTMKRDWLTNRGVTSMVCGACGYDCANWRCYRCQPQSATA